MHANRTHANHPSRYTNADIARMMAAQAAHDRMLRFQRMRDRVLAVTYNVAALAVGVAMFYSI